MAKGEFILEFMANEMGKSLENLSEEIEASLRTQIAEVAHGAYASIVAAAQSGLDKSKQDYLKGLDFQKLDSDTYLITLLGKYPNDLETGYPAFDMKAGMLRSNKIVEVGPRTGQPWVQQGKNGKYAQVPFEHKPFSKAPQGRDMADAIKQLTANNIKGERQRITKIFRDASGRPIDSGSGINTRPVARATNLGDLDPQKFGNLAGLAKFQKIHKNEKTGKETVQSIYMTWRTVSENSPGWKHPGFKGLHAFEDTERWVEDQLNKILREFLG